MRRLQLTYFRRILFAVGSTQVFALLAFAAPAIRNLQYNLPQVPRYEKFELTFTLDTVAQNPYFPYDPSPPAGILPEIGVSADAQFTPDNWQTIYTIPAFYYQDFEHEFRSGTEWIYPTQHFCWKVRFSPHKEGTWQFRVVARDRTGISLSPVQSFAVVPSANKGFIWVSRRDPRYFEYGDGTYFPALGYNMNFDLVSWRNPLLDNQENFQVMQQNGIQLIRIWLSQWGIFGSEWNPWSAQDPALHGQYLPYTGITFEEALPESEVSMKIDAKENPCMFIGLWKARPAVKPNTEYRVRVLLKTKGISDPRFPGQPYGFVAKTGGWLWGNGSECNNPGTGSLVTPYLAGDTPGWQILEGKIESGASEFLPNFYLVLENVSAGAAYIDHVWIEEKRDNGEYGPNIVAKPWMAHHLYFEQRNSYAFDRLLELAKTYGIYFRVVLHEKNDRLLSAFDYSGQPAKPDQNWFYGNYVETTKVRWLLQAFWRYAQARWGYAPQIHSWELLNEGDPWNSRHYTLAEEFGRYMHCQVFGETAAVSDPGRCSQENPNAHLVSTSFWHSFPKEEFWANSSYANIDFADVHEYIPEDRSAEYSDTAFATASLSEEFGARQPRGAGKPLIRGETGFVTTGSGLPSTKLLQDVQGLWLHNFIWGGINPGGMIESYWFYDAHIRNRQAGLDHRKQFGPFYRFILDIPLNNGQYQDTQAAVSNSQIRAWGQKDLLNGKAHLWIQNRNHTWVNVVDGWSIQPESGTVSVAGFKPGSVFLVEWWDTWTSDPNGHVFLSELVQADVNGSITLTVKNLVSDVAARVAAIGSEQSRPRHSPARLPGGSGRTR